MPTAVLVQPPTTSPLPRRWRTSLAAALLTLGLSLPCAARNGEGADDVQGRLTSVSAANGAFRYTITLSSHERDAIHTFWYSWTPGKNFLPTSPTNLQPPAGWTAKVTHDSTTDGYGIQWVTTGAGLTPGAPLTFGFDSTDTPDTLAGASTLYPTFAVGTSFYYQGAPFSDAGTQFVVGRGPSACLDDNVSLGHGIHFLQFPSGHAFGYFSYLSDDHYIYHQDMGFEYVFDADDSQKGMYLYDFATKGYFYTSPTFPFPYLYDFTLNTVVYYFPNADDSTHYNTNGKRYFYRFDRDEIFSK